MGPSLLVLGFLEAMGRTIISTEEGRKKGEEKGENIHWKKLRDSEVNPGSLIKRGLKVGANAA